MGDTPDYAFLMSIVGKAVEMRGGCLEVPPTDRSEYYKVHYGGKVVGVARSLVENREGRELERHEYALHLCDNAACINPEHLMLGDAKENARHAKALNKRGRFGPKGVPKETIEKMQALRDEGHTLGQIARRVSVSRATVDKHTTPRKPNPRAVSGHGGSSSRASMPAITAAPSLINTSVAGHLCGLTHLAVHHWIEQCFVGAVPFETMRGISYLVRRQEIEAVRSVRAASMSWATDLRAVAQEHDLKAPCNRGAISLA